jgi:hypothetical protein
MCTMKGDIMEKFKSLIKKVTDAILSGYEALKVALGFPTRAINANGEEVYILDGEEVLVDDANTLNKKTDILTNQVINICSSIFLIIVSMILVDEFFFIILILIEIGAVYWFLNYLFTGLFNKKGESNE